MSITYIIRKVLTAMYRPAFEQLNKLFLVSLFQLHLAALTSYKNEIFDLNSRLNKTRTERDQLRKQQSLWSIEKQNMQHEFEDRLQSQVSNLLLVLFHK